MALMNVTHKPTGATARQFDGTLEAFLDIINARSKAGLAATCRFNEAGDFVSLTLSGPNGTIQLSKTDWAIFPTDASQPVTQLTNTEALAAWQAAP